MCGLVGIAGDLSLQDEGTMKRLLIYDYFRGPDSTGFAALRKSGDVHLSKIASHPLDLFGLNKFTTALSGYNSSVFLGHNRAATRGKVNGVNAHPFQYDHIVGAHNGTLDQASWKRLNAVLGYDTDVDSQAIIACIAKIGIEDTVKLMEEGRNSLDGAWALTWFDLKDNTLNFLRNKHRPLWYGYTKNFKKLFWASEWKMIDAAVNLAPPNNSYDMYECKEGWRFWAMQEDWWYRFDLKALTSGSDAQPKPRVKELKGREPAPVVSSAGSAPFQGGWGQTTNSHGTTTTGTTTDIDHTPKMLKIPNCTDENPFGDFLSVDRFSSMVRTGCSWCSENIPDDAKGIIIYDMTGQVLCQECSGNKDTTRIYTCRAEIEAFVHSLKRKDNLLSSTALTTVQ
jgi:hypothetical protein